MNLLQQLLDVDELNTFLHVIAELRLILLRFFFFSSRSRHTSSFGDWSSDVCSSDLHSGDGDLFTALFTSSDVAEAIARAKRNPEDMPPRKRSLWERVFG